MPRHRLKTFETIILIKENKWQSTIVKIAVSEHGMTKNPGPLSVVYGGGMQTGVPVGKGTLHHCRMKTETEFHEHTI